MFLTLILGGILKSSQLGHGVLARPYDNNTE